MMTNISIHLYSTRRFLIVHDVIRRLLYISNIACGTVGLYGAILFVYVTASELRRARRRSAGALSSRGNAAPNHAGIGRKAQ